MVFLVLRVLFEDVQKVISDRGDHIRLRRGSRRAVRKNVTEAQAGVRWDNVEEKAREENKT